MNEGGPCFTKSSAKLANTSSELRRRATVIARNWRLNSSMTVSIFKWPAIYRTVGDEIIGPHVVRVLWPQPDEGAVVEPQPSTFRLSGRYLEPFTPPDALHPLGVDAPALGARNAL